MESARAQAVRARYGVPDALRLRVDAREVLAFLPDCEVAVRAVASGAEGLPRAEVGGRAPLLRAESEGGPLLVRPFRKGGLLRHVRGSRFHGSWRPLSELVLHRRLAASGVPVADAVGCVVLRGWLGWRGFFLSRELEGALDLEAFLHGVSGPPDLEAATILRRAGRAVRRLHDAGVSHADLHAKNLLITREGEVLVIDLDRAGTVSGPLSDEARMRNLLRLGRAVEKHRLKGMRTGRREALRFLEGYAGSREAAAEWLDRLRARLTRGLSWRILWWRLIGEARPWGGNPAAGGHGS